MIIDRKRQKRVVMIRLENVCFAYEKEIALRYVDLHINRGDSIVIQGPNGCGKSTLDRKSTRLNSSHPSSSRMPSSA